MPTCHMHEKLQMYTSSMPTCIYICQPAICSATCHHACTRCVRNIIYLLTESRHSTAASIQQRTFGTGYTEQGPTRRDSQSLYVGSPIPLVRVIHSSTHLVPPISPTPILFSYCIQYCESQSRPDKKKQKQALGGEWSLQQPTGWEFKGTETCGHVIIGKGTPLKPAFFGAFFQTKQQLAMTAPPI